MNSSLELCPAETSLQVEMLGGPPSQLQSNGKLLTSRSRSPEKIVAIVSHAISVG